MTTLRDRLREHPTTPDNLPYGCRCGQRWSGTRTCHCGSGCHRTFAGIAAFDAHRRNGQCHDPHTINGMFPTPHRSYPCWSGEHRTTPGPRVRHPA